MRGKGSPETANILHPLVAGGGFNDAVLAYAPVGLRHTIP